MRLHRFFVDKRIDDETGIIIHSADQLHQMTRVFRFVKGDRVIVLDNSGFEFLCEIMSLNPSEGLLRVIEKRENRATPRRDVFLFQSVIKKDKFEWVLEKCTEVGVSHFRPVLSERSEKKDVNFERSRKIVLEASEQSGRAKLPAVYEVMTLEEAIKSYAFPKVAFDPTGIPYREEDFQAVPTVGIFIGPEGGWSEKDLALFTAEHIPLLSLGAQTLRAETASVVATAKFLC